MPAKKTTLTEAERKKRIRDAAAKAEADEDPKGFERAFKKVVKLRDAIKSPPSRGSGA